MPPTTAGHRALAQEVADALGETGAPGQAPRARVEAQIAGIALVLGDVATRDAMNIALAVHGAAEYAVAKTRGGRLRTLGGAFFAEARRLGWHRVGLGTVTRRVFFQTFCWREPAPKPPTPARPKPEKKPQPPRPVRATSQGAREHGRRHNVPEVFVRRRIR